MPLKLPFKVLRTYLKLNTKPQLYLNYQQVWGGGGQGRATLAKLPTTPSTLNLFGQLGNRNSLLT